MYGTPNLLAVTLSLPVKSVQELIDYAKKNPDVLLFASTGNGSSVHVGMELFKLMTGTQMVHVPYKAATVAIADLTAGRVHLMADNINSIGPHVKAAAARPRRHQRDTRAGVFGIADDRRSGRAWFRRRRVGRGDRARWRVRNDHHAPQFGTNNALAAPAVSDKLPEMGLVVVGGTPEQFAAHIRKEARDGPM